MHAAVLLAGGTGLFPKFLAVEPLLMTCARTLFGGMTLLVFARMLGVSLRLPRARTWLVLAGSGAILAVHWFAFFQSVRVSTVAIGVLGLGSLTLFATFLEPLVFRERLHRRDIVAGFLVVAGLLLITPAFDLGNVRTQGLLWGVGAGFAYAVFSLVTRAMVRELPAVSVAFHQQIFAGLASLPLAWPALGAVSGRDWLALLLLGVVFTGVSQWLMTSSLRHLSVQTNSVLLSLEPIYAILLASMLLGETPDLRTVFGGAVLCGTVLWTSLRPPNRAGQRPLPPGGANDSI